MTALLTITGFSLVALGLRSRRKRPSRLSAPSREDRKLAWLRDRFAASDLPVEELERHVEETLSPTAPTERVEVHVWDAPPGSHLHIHL